MQDGTVCLAERHPVHFLASRCITQAAVSLKALRNGAALSEEVREKHLALRHKTMVPYLLCT